VQPQGLSQRNISVMPSGMKVATFRVVTQCLNQLRYRVPNTISWHRLRIYRNASFGVHNQAKHNQKYGDELLEGDKTTHTLTPATLSSQTRYYQPNNTASTLYFTAA